MESDHSWNVGEHMWGAYNLNATGSQCYCTHWLLGSFRLTNPENGSTMGSKGLTAWNLAAFDAPPGACIEDMVGWLSLTPSFSEVVDHREFAFLTEILPIA